MDLSFYRATVSSASVQSYLNQDMLSELWLIQKIISRKIREIGRCCSSRRKKNSLKPLWLLIKCVRYFSRRATE